MSVSMQASIPNWTKLFILNWIPSLPPTILLSDAYFYSVQLKVGKWLLQMMAYWLSAQTRRRASHPILFLSHCLQMRESRVGLELLYSACHLVHYLFGVLYGWWKEAQFWMGAPWGRVRVLFAIMPLLISSLGKEGHDYHLLSVY